MAGNFALILSQNSSSQDSAKNLDSLMGDIKSVIAQQKKNFSYGRATEKILGPGLLAKFISEIESTRKDRLEKNKQKNSVSDPQTTGSIGMIGGSSNDLTKSIFSELSRTHETIFDIALNVTKIKDMFQSLMVKSGLQKLQDRENLLEGSRKKKVQNIADGDVSEQTPKKKGGFGSLLSILGTILGGGILATFSKFSKGIMKFLGIFKVATKLVGKLFLPIMAVITIFDTVKATIEGYKEGGIVGAIKGAITGFFTSLVTVPLDLIKDLIAWTVGKMGFKEGEELLNAFSFTGLFTSLVDGVFSFVSGVVDWIKKQLGFTGEGMPDFQTLITGILSLPFNMLITTITGVSKLVAKHFDSIADIGKGFMAMFGIKPKEKTLNSDVNIAREDVRGRGMSQSEKEERKKNIVKLLTDQNAKKPKNQRLTPQQIDEIAEDRVRSFSSSLSSGVESALPTINGMMTENARMISIAQNDRITPSVTVTAPSVTSVDARSSNNAFLQPVERNQDRALHDIRGGWG